MGRVICGRDSDLQLSSHLNQVVGSRQQNIDITRALQPAKPPLAKGFGTNHRSFRATDAESLIEEAEIRHEAY